MQRKYLPVGLSKSRVFIFIGFIIFIYLLDNLPTSTFVNFTVYSNFIKPALWLCAAGLVWLLPKVRSRAPLKLRTNINWWAFNFAVIFILLSVTAGLFDGFGKSPYNHSIKGILTNFLVVGTMLFGREYVRNYLINNLTKHENFLVFIAIALLMTLISFKINKFTELGDLKGAVILIAQFIAPEFLQNLMATYLSFLGGWLSALIYTGVMQAFHWFSPVLPDLKWITAALVGIVCPAYSLASMQTIYLYETKLLKKTDKSKEGLAGWIVTSLFSIGIIWFSVGVFPIYPSVIATGSMEPMIKPGDMILVERILEYKDIERLKVGDVIQFKRDDILISHRIIEIVEEEDVMYYRTKGDNNSGPDSELVRLEDIKGSIRFVVPKIGWPTLFIKGRDTKPMENMVL